MIKVKIQFDRKGDSFGFLITSMPRIPLQGEIMDFTFKDKNYSQKVFHIRSVFNNDGSFSLIYIICHVS